MTQYNDALKVSEQDAVSRSQQEGKLNISALAAEVCPCGDAAAIVS